jgi:hypothetical protein
MDPVSIAVDPAITPPISAAAIFLLLAASACSISSFSRPRVIIFLATAPLTPPVTKLGTIVGMFCVRASTP